MKSFPDISKLIKKNVFNLTVIGEYKSLPEIKLEKQIKILLRGETCVGCNTLSNISIGDKFIDSPAIVSFQHRIINFFVNCGEVKVQLWNGPGQEQFRSIFNLIIKDTDIVIFVYDISNSISFRELNYHIETTKDKLGNKFIGAIVANKSDLDHTELDVEQGRILAKENNFKFYLVSAKDNQQAFIKCLDELVSGYISAVHPELLN